MHMDITINIGFIVQRNVMKEEKISKKNVMELDLSHPIQRRFYGRE
jgi:hypothetical protein